MADTSPRLALPLLISGQSQKEFTHNEALLGLEMLVQAVVQDIGVSAPPPTPLAGQCWIVGPGATGAWSAKDNQIAMWTTGGWRFAAPFDGMKIWSVAGNLPAAFDGANWTIGKVIASSVAINGVQVLGPQQPAIPAPSGGTTIDNEARIAIAALLGALRTHGLIAL